MTSFEDPSRAVIGHDRPKAHQPLRDTVAIVE